METHIHKEENLGEESGRSGALPLRFTSKILVEVKVIKIQDAAVDKLSLCIATMCACIVSLYIVSICPPPPIYMKCPGNTAQQMVHL